TPLRITCECGAGWHAAPRELGPHRAAGTRGRAATRRRPAAGPRRAGPGRGGVRATRGRGPPRGAAGRPWTAGPAPPPRAPLPVGPPGAVHAAVRLDAALAPGAAAPGPVGAPRGAGPPVAVEDVRQVGGRDPDAPVGDRDARPGPPAALLAAHGHGHLAAGR